jgi:hypothetical protein
MRELEQLLGLFVAAVLLAALARRVGAPYPVFLALGGALLAFLPGAPSFSVPPELALALFVAPVLLDAAYDASPRDLRDNWLPLLSLVVFAVGLTTATVAVVAHTLIPAMPWAAAIALGAIVAPPDAVAATAVLRPLRPPHRLLTILEGESLLNDASALLIYRLAVGAIAAKGFSFAAGRTHVPARSGRQPGCGTGARVDHLAVDETRAARAHGHHPSVRYGARRVDPCRTHRALGCAHDGVLRHFRGAGRAATHSRPETPPDLCRLGDRRFRAEHPGVYLHRPADPAHLRELGSR